MGTKTLKVLITGSAAGAKRAFNDVTSAGGGMASKLRSIGKVAAVGLAGLGAAAAGFAVKSASTFTNVAKDVAKLSRITGLGAGAASKLRFVAGQSGIGVDKLSKSLVILSKNIVSGKVDDFSASLKMQAKNLAKAEAAQDKLTAAKRRLEALELRLSSKKDVTANDRLSLANAKSDVVAAQGKVAILTKLAKSKITDIGIKFRDAAGKMLPMDKVLGNVADRFKKMANGPEKAALATKLFGKSGAELLPLLNKGSGAIDKLKKKASELGVVLSEKDVDAMRESSKQSRLFHAGMEGLQIQVGRYVLPIMTKLVGFLASKMPRAVKFVSDVINKVRSVIGPFFNTLRTGLTENEGTPVERFAIKVRSAFAKVRAAVVPIAHAFVSFGQSVGRALTGKVLPALKAFAAFAMKHKEVLVGFAVAIGAAILLDVVPAFAAWAVGAGSAAVATLLAAAPILLVVAGIGLLAAGLIYAYKHFTGFRNVVDGVAKWLTGTAWPAIKSFASGVATVFGAVISWVGANWPKVAAVIARVIGVIRTVVGAGLNVLRVLWSTFGDKIIGLVKVAWSYVSSTIHNALTVVQGIVRLVMAVIHGDWGKAWDAIVQILRGVWDQITNVARTAIGALKLLLSAAWAGIKLVASTAWAGIKLVFSKVWDGIKSTAKGAIDGVVGFFTNLPGRILSSITAITLAAAGIGASIMHGIAKGLSGAASFVGDLAGKLWDGIKGFINDRLDTIRNFKISAFGVSLTPFTALPRLHLGGTYRAPRPGGEGLALLRDGERVSTPGNDNGRGSRLAGGIIIENLNLQTKDTTRQSLDELGWRIMARVSVG